MNSLVSLALAVALFVSLCLALNNGVGVKPVMGWNSWNAFSCNDQCVNGDPNCISEDLLKGQAEAMVSSGMAAVGYQYVSVDDCWLTRNRSANGSLQADPTRFPSGIPALAQYIESLGLKFGIYLDSGTHTCEDFTGSFGYEVQDAKTIASWGASLLKLDGCYLSSDNTVMEPIYTLWSQALNATGRPIVFSCSWPAYNHSANMSVVANICNMWREYDDITSDWDHIMNILDYQASSGLRAFASPGAFNDPDMLEIGNGLADNEARVQFSLWAILAAPLIAGNDLRNMTVSTRSILTNLQVIQVDQDSMGIEGWLVKSVNSSSGLTQVWMRPLVDGSVATALLNRGSSAEYVEISLHALQLRSKHARSIDLWTSAAQSWSDGKVFSTVPSHDVTMLRVWM